MSKAPQRPYSIRIFVADGDLDGLRLVEKPNSAGLGVVLNCTMDQQSVVRPEFGLIVESALATMEGTR